MASIHSVMAATAGLAARNVTAGDAGVGECTRQNSLFEAAYTERSSIARYVAGWTRAAANVVHAVEAYRILATRFRTGGYLRS